MSARYAKHLLGGTLASLFFSSSWYVGFDATRAYLLADLGVATDPAGWLAMLEPVRTLVVAVAMGAVIGRLVARTRGEAVAVALVAFAAFPGVLLTGSVIHGESSAGLAAIHAGDWLVKLTVVALVMRRYHFGRQAASVESAHPVEFATVPDGAGR